MDRFCDAMIAIRKEIGAIAAGESDAQDNVYGDRNLMCSCPMVMEMEG